MKSDNKTNVAIDHSRKIAADLLVGIWRNEMSLETELGQDVHFDIRARAVRIARETLRNEHTIEGKLRAHFKKQPKPAVRAIIYIGYYEILFEYAAPHGVVHDLVALAKSQVDTKSSASFINAILRKAEDTTINPRNGETFSNDLKKHLRQQYTKAELADMNLGQLQIPQIDIRLKPSEDVGEWARKLDAQPLKSHHCLRLPLRQKISELDGFESGMWWVQDAGATIAVDCFSDLKGKKALDLCAAPGGKTMQMCANGADVTSLDLSERRAQLILENLERTELAANVVVGDALEFNDGTYDAILLDAPCTATGTFRRHPDLKYGEPLERMAVLLPIQVELLQHAFRLLNVGGELVYCTCSLLKEEGETQIEAFLATEPQAELVKLDGEKFGLKSDHSPFIRTFPSHNDTDISMDGFFIAKLTKKNSN